MSDRLLGSVAIGAAAAVLIWILMAVLALVDSIVPFWVAVILFVIISAVLYQMDRG